MIDPKNCKDVVKRAYFSANANFTTKEGAEQVLTERLGYNVFFQKLLEGELTGFWSEPRWLHAP